MQRKGLKQAIVAGALIWQSQTFYSPEDSAALLECLSLAEQTRAKIVLVPLPEPQGYYFDGQKVFEYSNLWTLLYRDNPENPAAICQTDPRNNCVAVTCQEK